MLFLLQACRSYPLCPDVFERLNTMPEWEQARNWGWILRTGELTGMGASHAGQLPKGIVKD
jgi:hypothetical protein